MGRLREDLNLHHYPEETSTLLYDTQLYEIDPEFVRKYETLVDGQFFYNNPSRESVERAEMRLDEPRMWPKTDESKVVALTYVDQILEIPLTTDIWSHEETYNHIDKEKGTGFPISLMGYKKRDEFFTCPDFLEKMHSSDIELLEWLSTFPPFVKNVGKVEMAKIIDLKDKKSRTFNVHNVANLYLQERILGPGNENMKNYVWSAYGMNPFGGGVDKMASEFLSTIDGKTQRKFPILMSWDARGYDRKVDLRNVSKRRYRYLKKVYSNNPRLMKVIRHVCDGLVITIMIMTNGDVVIRVRGNNSGSGATTVNNIEAGYEIVTDVLVAAYYSKYGEFPEYDVIYEQLVKLYGDDNAMALMIEFERMTDEIWLRKRLMEFHGIELKELFVTRIPEPGDLEVNGNYLTGIQFLGFEFAKMEHGYLPRWDISRILLTVMKSATSKQYADVFIQRAFAVLIMSYGSDLWSEYRQTYCKILKYYMNEKNHGSGHPIVKTYIQLGAPDEVDLDKFYFGLEAGGPKYELLMKSIKGNDYLAVYQPVFTIVDDHSRCTIRCIGFDNMPVIGDGLTDTESYSAALDGVREKLEALWAPPPLVRQRAKILESYLPKYDGDYEELAVKIVKGFRSKNCGLEKDNILKVNKNENKQRNSKEIKTGSFNPYGNGQTEELEDNGYDSDHHPITDAMNDLFLRDREDEDELGRTVRELFGWNPMKCEEVPEFVKDDVHEIAHTFEETGQFMSQDERLKYWSQWKRTMYHDMKYTAEQNRLVEELREKYMNFKNPDWVDHVILGTDFTECIPKKYHKVYEDQIGIIQMMPYQMKTPCTSFKKKYLEMEPLQESFVKLKADGTQETCWKSVVPSKQVTRQKELNGMVNQMIEAIGLLKKIDQKIDDMNSPRVGKEYKEGGFNPYGNAQKGGRAQFIDKKVKGGMSQAEASALWTAKKKAKKARQKNRPIPQPSARRPPVKAGGYSRSVRPGSKQAIEISYQKPSQRQGNFMPGSIEVGPMQRGVMGSMSPCAAKYAHTLTHPFHYLDGDSAPTSRMRRFYKDDMSLPCIPTFPAISSRKLYVVTRFTATADASTGGLAFAFAPWRLANNYDTTDVNDCPIMITGSNWGGNGSTWPTFDTFTTGAPATGVTFINVPSEFAQTDLAYVGSVAARSRGVKYRLVAAGARVMYIGAVMNRSGLYNFYQTSDHSSLSGVTTTSIANIPSYFTREVDDKFHTISYVPVDPGELNYSLDGIVNHAGQGADTVMEICPLSQLCHYMGFTVSGGTPSGQYQIQTVQCLEVIGEPVQGKTKSDADIAGLSKTLNIASPTTAPVLDNTPGLVEKMIETSPQSTNELVNNVMATGSKMLKDAAPNLLEKGLAMLL